MRTIALFTLLLTGLIINSCSNHNPVLPDDNSDNTNQTIALQQSDILDKRTFLGLWTIRISADRSNIELIPERMPDMHINALYFLQDYPCNTCLSVSNVILYSNNELVVHLKIDHPFPGLDKFSAFDVRGIFISKASYLFPDSGRRIAWGNNVPTLLNPDGYTELFNPTEYPYEVPGPLLLKYLPGHLSAGGDLTSTLNPYVAYKRDKTRRIFEAGTSDTRGLRLHFPSGEIEFGYAIDCSWEKPPAVIEDPVEDFPDEANCAEARDVTASAATGLGVEPGSITFVEVEYYKYEYAYAPIPGVTVESPELFNGIVELEKPGSSEPWQGYITNEKGAGPGDYPVLVRVTSSVPDKNLGQIDAWQVCTAHVGQKKGWVRTWSSTVEHRDVTITDSCMYGSTIYVIGLFEGLVDFDPGPNVEEKQGPGTFICKYDTNGNFLWVKTWPDNTSGLYAYGILKPGIAVDSSGNFYVAGSFKDTIDFNPDGGYALTSHGGLDCYLLKFTPVGDLIWGISWGSAVSNPFQEGNDEPSSVIVDKNDKIYVAGYFLDSLDFDPGMGEDIQTANGWFEDCFVSKFEPNGAHIWTVTWGGEDPDYTHSLAIDDENSVWITGKFQLTCDFDPGAGSAIRTSNGSYDSFLTSFDPDGTFRWAGTWGNAKEYDSAMGICADSSVYVSGSMYSGMFGSVDTDPGPAVNSVKGSMYLSRFNTNGSLIWSFGSHGGASNCVTPDSYGSIYVNSSQYSVLKVSVTGFIEWQRDVGWSDNPIINISSDNKLYIAGKYMDDTDFDPGAGEDFQYAPPYTLGGFIAKFPPDLYW